MSDKALAKLVYQMHILNTTIEAMNAFNAIRAKNGVQPGHDEHNSMREAEKLEAIAKQIGGLAAPVTAMEGG